MTAQLELSVQTGECLVPNPRLGEDVILATAAGKTLVLGFYPSEAEISRQADALVFLMENGGSVSIPDFFTAEQAPVLFALPDGTQLSALDFFASFNPDLAVAMAALENDTPEVETRLDDLLEGVGRMGALGTLYWGDAARLPEQIEEVSFRVESALGPSSGPGSSLAASPYLQAYDNTGVLKPGEGATQVNEISPGYYQPGQERRESISLPDGKGDSGGWDVSGELNIYEGSSGQPKAGLSASDSESDPFAETGFDLAAFIRGNTPLQNWEQGKGGLGCLKREVAVGADETDPKIELAWSMLPGETADPSDVTLALLFKVGPDGSLVYVDHKVLEYDGLDAAGRPQAASGGVSWSVEPGESYVTSLVVAGPGAVLVLEGMEYVYQAEPVWVEPVYEEVYLFTAEASGNLIADPSGDDDISGGVDRHSEGQDFSVVRFFLNGEWHQAGGEPICWEDENGAGYRFSLNGQGEYSLEVRSADLAFVPDHNLSIVYEIESADGLKDQASLRLAAQDELPAAPAPVDPFMESIIAGDALDDIFPDSTGASAAPGAEIPAWPGGLDDTSFVVTDFSLANDDRLTIANLLAESEVLEQLLDSGRLTLYGEEDTLRLDLSAKARPGPQVDVSFQAGELENFSSAYVEKNGSADGMEQALLQIMLFGS